MTPKRTVDLLAVRVSRERLAKLARKHPDLTAPRSAKNVTGWVDTLAAIEEDTMPNEPTVQCAFRLPASLVERLDDYAKRMGDDQPGLTFTRADAVRVLLTRALGVSAPRPKRKRP